ncbi:MAG: DUF3365 domain-containing protein [Sedimentisphaerales bacterium]|nr:DUF3365 domain-containing protein [Sedimentisphaerales bacterium]MBN2843640.1 DUF3365 domain-containing protein [Sedimentisphaerales bacterium]
MPKNMHIDNGKKQSSRLSVKAVLIVAGWTVLVIISLLCFLTNESRHINQLAIKEARANFEKDQAFRLWATSHGGVYVRLDEITPPNPYLQNLPDRDLTTVDGLRLTLMNPAYMVRQLNEQFSRMYGIHGNITSLKPLRPENEPDSWQKMALEAFEQGESEVTGFSQIDGEPYFRLMKPMLVQEGCLKCHGTQGYKVGDMRGGVSVSIPMAGYIQELTASNFRIVITHFLLWLIGLAGIWFVIWCIRRNIECTHRTNESLLESKLHYDNVMLASNDGMFELNMSDMTVRYSDRWFTMLDYMPGELPETYETWKKLLPLDQVEQIEREIMELIRTQQRWSYEFRMQNKTGNWVWILVRGYCVKYDTNGSPLIVVGAHTDITERKISESMLAARLRLVTAAENCTLKELLRAFLDEAEKLTYSKIGFFHFLEQENIVALQMWSSNTLAKMCNLDASGSKYQLAHAGVWADCVREGKVVVHNDYASLPNKKGLPPGHAPVTREIVIPISRNNKMVAFFGLGNKETYYQEYDIKVAQELADMAWDIITRKQAEIELKQHRDQLEELVRERTNELNEKNTTLEHTIARLRETQSQLILFEKMTALRHLVSGIAHEINNPLGAISSSRELLEINIRKLVNSIENVSQWLKEPEGDILADLLNYYTTSGQNETGKITSREKRAIRSNIAEYMSDNNIADAQELAIMLVELNICKDIEKLLPLLRRSDIKDILHMVGCVLDSYIACNTIQIAVSKAARIVNALGGYIRKDGDQQNKVLSSVKKGLDNVLVLFHNVFTNFVSLDIEIPADLPDIMCYPDQLNQVWTNIIQNALYAMGNKGKLVIKVELLSEEIVVRIVDQGCGMPPEVKARVFEPLFTTKPVGEGIGLGMDIVYMIIVERHNGRIEIESEPGKGTTVSVWLPVGN